uniref:Uncharacterized protein n=1 Tax=Quercus lobata TaxID=97700 RepID=A0A7N2KW27_QUELO
MEFSGLPGEPLVPLFCSFANRACPVPIVSVNPFSVFSHSFLLLVLILLKASGWPSSSGRAEVCDLSSVSEIKSFASRFSSKDVPIHILVNNAGLLEHKRVTTSEGFELNFSVNVLGTYSITELMLPLVEKAAPDARVITVSSGGMYTAPLTTDLQYSDSNFNGVDQYARNKRVQFVLAFVFSCVLEELRVLGFMVTGLTGNTETVGGTSKDLSEVGNLVKMLGFITDHIVLEAAPLFGLISTNLTGLHSEGARAYRCQSIEESLGEAGIQMESAENPIVALTEKWAEMYKNKGIGFYSMHPGWAETPGVAKSLPGLSERLSGNLRTSEEGADTIIWLALQPKEKLVSGAFYFDRAEAPKHLMFSATGGSHVVIDSVVDGLRSLSALSS